MTNFRITTKKKAIEGTATDDTFLGSRFSDIFDGRAGDDYIYRAEGNDRLNGGDGHDDIYGAEGADRVYGGLGRDGLYGNLGNDLIYGDAGQDRLSGNEGNDKLYGGEGDDRMSGAEGNDHLDGGEDGDELDGGEGNDKLYGDEGDDIRYGAEGNDRLEGDEGDDELSGRSGRDYLSGGAGDDILDGREFSNVAKSLLGSDRLFGGDGNDTVFVDDNDNALRGKGVDTLDIRITKISGDYTNFLINFSKITGKKAADIGYLGIKAGQLERVSADIKDMDVGSVITGTKNNDTITGSGKGGVIYGGTGDDKLAAYSYDTTPGTGFVVIGGAGDDVMRGGGNVTLVGGAGGEQFELTTSSGCTIADFSGKDYFIVHTANFQYYDFDLKKIITPVFDKANPVVSGADPNPTTTLAQFLYDTDDGKLYYDADGIGLKHGPQLAMTLSNKTALNASDFFFVV